MNSLPQELADAFNKIATSGKAIGDKPFIIGGFVRDWLWGLAFEDIPDLDVICENGKTNELVSDLCVRFGLGSPKFYDFSGTMMLVINGYKFEFQSPVNENVHFPVKDDLIKMGIEPTFFNRNVFERDFTIDTLCYDLIDNEILDITGQGYDDLENKILDTPINPQRALEFNPYIVLRGIKFICQFGLKMSKNFEKYFTYGVQLLPQSLSQRSEKHTKELINKTFELNEEMADELYYKYGLYDMLPMPQDLIEKSIKKHMLGIEVQKMSQENPMASFDYNMAQNALLVGTTIHCLASEENTRQIVQKAVCDLYINNVINADTKLIFIGEDKSFGTVNDFMPKLAALQKTLWIKIAYESNLRVYDRFQKRKEYRDRKRREQKRDRISKIKSWRDFHKNFMI